MKIYIQLNNKEVGPHTEEQLRVFVKTGAISQTQKARLEGRSEWQPLNTIISFGPGSSAPDGTGFLSPIKKEVQKPAKLLNILIVDDEKSTGKAVNYFLEHAGHKVNVVHDGEEALKLVKASPTKYQLLITDHSMPKMSGMELVEELQDAKFRGKIIVFTGYLNPDVESAYRLLGVKHFFKKPLDLKRLPDLIAKLD